MFTFMYVKAQCMRFGTVLWRETAYCTNKLPAVAAESESFCPMNPHRGAPTDEVKGKNPFQASVQPPSCNLPVWQRVWWEPEWSVRSDLNGGFT